MSRTLCLLSLVFLCRPAAQAADAARPWAPPALAAPRDVELAGPLGAALDKGIARLALPPYTEQYLRADVSFEMNRIFTNYSGDVSGRFLELASLTTPAGKHAPATLDPIVATICKYQKADGHFGADVDLSKPLTRNAAPIPMLWGNARLLVGLVTAARELNEPRLLEAAKRLGDFYVNSAGQLCAPEREKEYHQSGTGGDGYTCCYFPAIESLALLYNATKDERYLKQAQRMADFFARFDTLPIDHSHGNLCAYRGILLLYEITGDRSYLERAVAKWDKAVAGGFVWPLGGVGEHWYVFHPGDEGCSESDWLRFNLELWRFTGEGRYLDMAERLLVNQYTANQCANGGYGWRRLDGDAAGPVGTSGAPDEWPFCCSFHGPLGLYFMKGYLAAGSDRGVFVNLPFDFTSRVRVSGRSWKVAVRTEEPGDDARPITIGLVPEGKLPVRTALWVHVPGWAGGVSLAGPDGRPLPVQTENGYLKVERAWRAGEKIRVTFRTSLKSEFRRFREAPLEPAGVSRLREVTVLAGPQVLFASPAAPGRPVLLAMQDKELSFPKAAGSFATVALPGPDADDDAIAQALAESRPVFLRPWAGVPPRGRMAFVVDLVVVPAGSPSLKGLAEFEKRAADAGEQAGKPVYGSDLEKRPELWAAASGWKFTPEGLRVDGGEVGLLDGAGYGDYRFEFEMVLPKEGQGLTGWVVRAADEGDCLMFQIQSADSPYSAPEWKTKPNTLRPHVRHGGTWKLLDPVPLPKEVRRGETHRVAVECHGEKIDVFLDGEKVYSGTDDGLRTGAPGFRAGSATEQGLFRGVSVKKLE